MGSLIWLVLMLIKIALWIIIIQAVLSWLIAFDVVNRHSGFVSQLWNGLNRLTDPIYRPIRRIMPDLGGIDLTPLVVIIGLLFLERVIVNNAYALL
jgi:YggT family protein